MNMQAEKVWYKGEKFEIKERETIIISMRHKHTVAKSSVTCDHQTGLTKNAWVGMARKYTNKNK